MKLFVSYRRGDNRSMTERLCDRLADLFGREAIFKDVDSMPVSKDFRESLNEAIADCDAFLVVIGTQWLASSSEIGTRRIDQTGDYVRLEAERAITESVPIVPILIDGASLPESSDLPNTLRPLAFCHAIPLRYDPDFNMDFERLTTFLTECVIDEIMQEMVDSVQGLSPPFAQNPMVEDVSKAISTNPYNTRSLLWRASLGVGYSLTEGSAVGFQSAIADYRRIRELDSNVADAYFGLADLYYKAAIFDLVKRRCYRVVKLGRFGSDAETGLADIEYPIVEPLPDKHNESLFFLALSQLQHGSTLKQTTRLTGDDVRVFYSPDVPRVLSSMRRTLGLEPQDGVDEIFANTFSLMMLRFNREGWFEAYE